MKNPASNTAGSARGQAMAFADAAADPDTAAVAGGAGSGMAAEVGGAGDGAGGVSSAGVSGGITRICGAPHWKQKAEPAASVAPH